VELAAAIGVVAVDGQPSPPQRPPARGDGEGAAPNWRAGTLRTSDSPGEVLGQRGERAQAGGPVVGVVEERAHEGRADDHAVGVRRDLGGLVAVADAEADADGQVRRRRVRATSGPARSLVVCGRR
jgi:hypothetical protein